MKLIHRLSSKPVKTLIGLDEGIVVL